MLLLPGTGGEQLCRTQSFPKAAAHWGQAFQGNFHGLCWPEPAPGIYNLLDCAKQSQGMSSPIILSQPIPTSPQGHCWSSAHHSEDFVAFGASQCNTINSGMRGPSTVLAAVRPFPLLLPQLIFSHLQLCVFPFPAWGAGVSLPAMSFPGCPRIYGSPSFL